MRDPLRILPSAIKGRSLSAFRLRSLQNEAQRRARDATMVTALPPTASDEDEDKQLRRDRWLRKLEPRQPDRNHFRCF